MKFLDSLIDTGAEFYHTLAWRNFIEQHIPLILAQPDNTIATITPQQHTAYKYNVTGLLLALGVRYPMHYIVMRLNNITDTYSDTTKKSQLLIPSPKYIEKLLQQYRITG